MNIFLGQNEGKGKGKFARNSQERLWDPLTAEQQEKDISQAAPPELG